MDFLSILTTFTDKGFEWVGIALLVWVIVIYLPKRDATFLIALNKLRESMVEAEAKAHKEILMLLHDHDKHALENHAKIAEILRVISERK